MLKRFAINSVLFIVIMNAVAFLGARILGTTYSFDLLTAVVIPVCLAGVGTFSEEKLRLAR